MEPSYVSDMKIIDNERILFDKEDERELNRVIVTKIKDKTVI
jgi:hypothetical protein